MVAVHGPLGFTDLDHEGMLVEGFDQVGTLATLYNFSYYPQYLENLDYKKDVDWLEFRVKIPDKVPEKLVRLASMVQQRQKLQVVQTKRAKDILPYATEIFQLVNKAYENLYGVVPLTAKQTRYYTQQYFSFIRPEFVCLITDQQGRLAAFGITMPSLSAALQKANGRLFPFGFIHLMKALKILNAPWGGAIGARKITISTSGLVPQIRKLADEPLQFRLAISLHGATDETRGIIMPVNKKYPLRELTAACEYYQKTRGRMITFEYILIAGINDGLEQVKPLAALARRLNAKVNLIPYNRVEGLNWERPDEATQEAFLRALEEQDVNATLRREKGHDIDAACGQLRLKTERELATIEHPERCD